MGKQSNVEVAQRREAVLSLLRKEDTAAGIARRYQVSEPTLYRWRDEFQVTDNGSSFIARRFQEAASAEFSHVRIRSRTPQQLGLSERFHATLKSEEVYWRLYDNPQHARECLAEFRERYNQRRPHWALVPEMGGDPWVSAEVYAGGRTIQIPRWQQWATAAQARLEGLLKAAG